MVIYKNKSIISIRKDGLYLFNWNNRREPEISKLYAVYYDKNPISRQYETMGEACNDAFAFKDSVNGRWFGLIFRKRYDESIILYI